MRQTRVSAPQQSRDELISALVKKGDDLSVESHKRPPDALIYSSSFSLRRTVQSRHKPEARSTH